MIKLIKLFIFSLLSLNAIYAADEASVSLLNSVKKANAGLGTLDPSKNICDVCQALKFAHDNECPSVLTQSYANIHKRGTVGFLNEHLSDGAVKNPITSCSGLKDSLKNANTKEFYNELQSKFPNSLELMQITQRCNAPIDGDNENFAKNYMAYDFHVKANF